MISKNYKRLAETNYKTRVEHLSKALEQTLFKIFLKHKIKRLHMVKIVIINVNIYSLFSGRKKDPHSLFLSVIKKKYS